MYMDKRDLSRLFQQRLKNLVDRTGSSQTSFAASVGIDRSALSQLLSGQSTRLPRVETLLNIAEQHSVSLDWLLGISSDEGITGELRNSFDIEDSQPGKQSQTLLEKWHAEAAGGKVRYVPLRIPDLFRTHDVIAYETALFHRNAETQVNETTFRLDYNRQPGTDMETCMPVQTLVEFAAGQGIWTDLQPGIRKTQLTHMAELIDELYPSFRLYLYDARQRYSAPYTVFGANRAAIYVGEMYLVLNSKEAILSMQRHFDTLIRRATVNAHESAQFMRNLAVS
jgi:transcriptional regulator with XRE-family HTH domain